jgi:hypothetical protein
VHVSFATEGKLLGSGTELRAFGVTVKTVETFQKVAGAPQHQHGVVLDFREPLDHEILRELVAHVVYLGIPKDEILRLRLDEPEWIEALTTAEI